MEPTGLADTEKPFFVGGESCIECHKIEYDLWKQSDHDLAMTVAINETVLGDFDDALFVSTDGDTSTFSRRNGKFYVSTHSPGCLFGDFEITHTFGWIPNSTHLQT